MVPTAFVLAGGLAPAAIRPLLGPPRRHSWNRMTRQMRGTLSPPDTRSELKKDPISNFPSIRAFYLSSGKQAAREALLYVIASVIHSGWNAIQCLCLLVVCYLAFAEATHSSCHRSKRYPNGRHPMGFPLIRELTQRSRGGYPCAKRRLIRTAGRPGAALSLTY